MSPPRNSPPSFSAQRRWDSMLNAVIGVFAVLALVVMANYLAQRHFQRWFPSKRAALQLSPQTLGLLRTLTNQVAVTVVYDREDPFFSTVTGLLKEYHQANPHITLREVDYLRDVGAAQQIFTDYQLIGVTNKNLILFDCEGRVKRVDGNQLVQYTLELVPNSTEREFRRQPVAFRGEQMFSLALLAVANPKSLHAYFLTGHDEHDPDSGDDVQGYLKFTSLLRESYIQTSLLSLAGPQPRARRLQFADYCRPAAADSHRGTGKDRGLPDPRRTAVGLAKQLCDTPFVRAGRGADGMGCRGQFRSGGGSRQ